ncbi:hypothetical protein Cpir12675_004648 [Ceratocystis pirilliformis]|uniref:S-adenosyl-L-methionine-dependent methyltransferase n=1 Tax=Ceratocystis pirilliformis TaxID=259994 RepID=A0ABR3YUW6_9PEZI
MPRFVRLPRRNRPPGQSSRTSSTGPSTSSTPPENTNLLEETENCRTFDFTFDSEPVWGTSKGFRIFPSSGNFLKLDSMDGPPVHTPPPLGILDSKSLTESTLDFPEEFGRTYTAFRPGSYPYPNDLMESQRLNEQYHILNKVSGRLHFAPWSQKNPPRNVMDIATGTGLWAMDIADLYPEAQVQGNDLSPIQSQHVPPNLHFFVEDAEEEWQFTTPFDYIHTRCCLGAFQDFKKNIICQAFENLCPGGWLESQEIQHRAFCDDGTLSPDSPLLVWARELQEASEAKNRQIVIAPHLRQWYEEAGFVDVKEIVYKVPLNPWPQDAQYKEIGRRWERILLDGMSGFSLALFNRYFGRSREEIEAQLVPVRRDISNPNIHAYQKYHMIIGRKPFEGETSMPVEQRSTMEER